MHKISEPVYWVILMSKVTYPLGPVGIFLPLWGFFDLKKLEVLQGSGASVFKFVGSDHETPLYMYNSKGDRRIIPTVFYSALSIVGALKELSLTL